MQKRFTVVRYMCTLKTNVKSCTTSQKNHTYITDCDYFVWPVKANYQNEPRYNYSATAVNYRTTFVQPVPDFYTPALHFLYFVCFYLT